MTDHWRALGVLIAAGLLASGNANVHAGESRPDPSAAETFETQVRPILIERCQSCHGAKKQKGGLRLDAREAILKGGDTGPAALPGQAEASLLVEAIRYGDDLQMPPRSKLPDDEIQILTRWVANGMAWPASTVAKPAVGPSGAFDLKARRDAHWAWQALTQPPCPEVRDAAWPATPEDRFILAALEAKRLAPAPQAERRVLIRRLSFDLTGLPPTPTELREYLNDTRPDAYERLADRLLASPRFGERWARHWLDLVRYAETRGHEFDPIIPNAWRYRDYVIRALNEDVPYDQFVTEHLAGDLLEPPRVDPSTAANESILGTGFWFLGEEVHSPVDLKQDEADRFDNRIDVMSKAFLGLTVACARCHDHKFDAISQRDYYALSGFLASSAYRQARFSTMEQERVASERSRSLLDAARPVVYRLLASALESNAEHLSETLKLARDNPSADPRGQAWASILKQAQVDPSHPLRSLLEEPRAAKISAQNLLVDFGGLAPLARFQNGSAFGPRPVQPGDLELMGTPGEPRLGLATIASARLDPIFSGLTLSKGNQQDHGRLGTWNRAGLTLRSPEFVIGDGPLYYLAKGAGRAYASIQSHLIIAGPLHGGVLTEWSEGGQGWRWVRHDLSVYKGHRAHVEFTPSGTGEFGVARVIQSEAPPGAIFEPVPDFQGNDSELAYEEGLHRLIHALNEGGQLSPAQARAADFALSHLDLFADEADPSRSALHAEIRRLADASETIASPLRAPSVTAPAMLDGNGFDQPLLIRGLARSPGDRVPRRFLEALDPNPETLAADLGSGRLELARRVTDPSNPLVSRVIVNRVWHHLFGRGIVASVDNFGELGDRPTHPELLDFLAGRFVQDGWSIKRLIRSIILSKTYRMSSYLDPKSDSADPTNLLVHRRAVKRLEAEPIRDAILKLSGRLDERVGGPSVATHLRPEMQGRGRPAESGPLDGDGRRSLYLSIRRNFLAPMMLAFDAPIPFSCMGRRNVSNVPAQALILMNDPFVATESRRWARRSAGQEAGPRIEAMYLAAFGREPSAKERERALSFVRSQASEPGEDNDGAWGDLAHVLLNAKEFLFIE